MNWLRHISAEFGFDERIKAMLPDHAPRSAYEALRRSKNGSVATPKSRKRKAGETDETTPRTKHQKRSTPPTPEVASESESEFHSEPESEPKTTPSSESEAATPKPGKIEGADSNKKVYVVDVDEAGSPSVGEETESTIVPVELEEETVPALELDNETEDEDEDEEDEEYCRSLFIGPQLGMLNKEKRLRKDLLDMLVESRRYESDEMTMSRELRWHREMTWAKFQTPWYRQYAI
jgi:hypothetical protein